MFDRSMDRRARFLTGASLPPRSPFTKGEFKGVNTLAPCRIGKLIDQTIAVEVATAERGNPVLFAASC